MYNHHDQRFHHAFRHAALATLLLGTAACGVQDASMEVRPFDEPARTGDEATEIDHWVDDLRIHCGLDFDAVDLMTDPDHCGACDNVCDEEQRCGDGICNKHRWSFSLDDFYANDHSYVAVAPNGDLFVAGAFYGERVPGSDEIASAGGSSLFVSRLDVDGTSKWLRRFSGDGSAELRGLTVAPDGNIVLAGHFDGRLDFGKVDLVSTGHDDAFVAVLSSEGKPRWARSFGEQDDPAGGEVFTPEVQRATDVAVDSDANILLTGFFVGGLDVDGAHVEAGGGQALFIVKLGPDGDVHWFHHDAGAGDQAATAVAVDPDGNVVVVGRFDHSLTFTGKALISADGDDFFVAKLAADGTPLWSESYGDAGDDVALAVGIDAGNGNITIGGMGSHGFVAMFDPDGNLRRSQTFAGVGVHHIADLAVNAAGEALVTGRFHGQLDTGMGMLTSRGDDLFVARFDAELSPLWSHRYGDAAAQQGTSVAADEHGQAIVAGSFDGLLDLGGQVLLSGNTHKAFFAAFGP